VQNAFIMKFIYFHNCLTSKWTQEHAVKPQKRKTLLLQWDKYIPHMRATQSSEICGSCGCIKVFRFRTNIQSIKYMMFACCSLTYLVNIYFSRYIFLININFLCVLFWHKIINLNSMHYFSFTTSHVYACWFYCCHSK
jgi:hypothetical protein